MCCSSLICIILDFKDKRVQEILIQAAVELARKKNASGLEAYPEPSSEPSKPFKTWNTFNLHQPDCLEMKSLPILYTFFTQNLSIFLA